MRCLFPLLLPCVLSACGSVMVLPVSARLDAPRDAWPALQAAQEQAMTQVYALDGLPVQAAQLQRLLRVLLPEGAHSSFHAALPRELEVHAGAEAQAAVAQLLQTYQTLPETPLGLTVRILELPWSTAGTLGPYQLVSPPDSPPIHSVPLSAAAVDWLWAFDEARSPRRRARGSSLACQPGQWQLNENLVECAYLEQISYGWHDHRRTADPVVSVARDAIKLSSLVLPHTDDAWLLAFELEDRLLAGLDELRSQAFGGNTDVTLTLPLWVDRQAQGAVVLGPGEALGLLAAGTQGQARLLVVLPVWGRAASATP